ncbi:MAG: spondin domain-containing protein [Gammaproteobacteria bacterium]|nr:spondin domain-containing protein [Gammaproteobacteria bacterium]
MRELKNRFKAQYKNTSKDRLKIGVVSILALSLAACFHNEDDDENMPVVAMYKVTVSNLTNGQPMTPVAIVVHKSGYDAWTLGGMASIGLEKLAEGGDTADFITEASANMNVSTTDVAGATPFGPGSSVMVEVKANYSNDLKLSLASMLANTNDAFTGLLSADIGSLAIGESMTMMSHVFDAGTESNTEASGTLAGPADESTAASKAYSATRDDLHDFVSVHAGVVTMDDGLTTSILDESHRWNGVAAKIMVERL